MLPRELVSNVAPITPVRPAEQTADPRQQALQRALAPQLGKALHGEVLTRLTDGSFVVKVADIPTRMLLPAGARVGAVERMGIPFRKGNPQFKAAIDKILLDAANDGTLKALSVKWFGIDASRAP